MHTSFITSLSRFGVSLLGLALLASSGLAVCHAQPGSTKGGKPAASASAPVQAALVQVEGAWIRPTVKGQTATGGFMNLTAATPLTLVGFASKVASETELHEMVMDGSVMRMRAMASLALPAGSTVSLRPGAGAQHLMLMGLKQPLQAGEEVALTLKLRTPEGKVLTQDVLVPVKAQAMPMGGSASERKAHHDMHHKMMSH